MRTIKDLAIPQNTDPKFPFGTILNETDIAKGTPVVEEIYGDVLTNIYKLLQTVGITPTATQDSDTSQYQILQALQNLPNKLNDIEQILTLTGTVWSVPLAIELLPNKYFFVARAAENYAAGGIYTFKGSGDTVYNFSSAGFKASDEVLVIIDTSGVRAYSLSFLETISDEIFTVMGLPIAFNDSNKMFYQSEGNLVSDTPSINYLEAIIRVDISDGTVIVNDIIISNGFVICFCFIPGTNTYFFRQFTLTDLSVSQAVIMVGSSFSNTSDFSPYIYASQGVIYITNAMNTTTNDYYLSKWIYAPTTANLTYSMEIDIDGAFIKTSNAVVKNNLLYTMVAGVLKSFNLNTGASITLGNYASIVGNLFGYNGNVYFGSGDVARKWSL